MALMCPAPRRYVFSPTVFDVIAHAIANKMHGPRSARRSVSTVDSFFVDPDEPRDFVRLDGDILTPYAGKKVRKRCSARVLRKVR